MPARRAARQRTVMLDWSTAAVKEATPGSNAGDGVKFPGGNLPAIALMKKPGEGGLRQLEIVQGVIVVRNRARNGHRVDGFRIQSERRKRQWKVAGFLAEEPCVYLQGLQLLRLRCRSRCTQPAAEKNRQQFDDDGNSRIRCLQSGDATPGFEPSARR